MYLGQILQAAESGIDVFDGVYPHRSDAESTATLTIHVDILIR